MPPQQDQEYDSDVPDIEPSYSESNSESESAFDSDEELMQVRAALVPIPDNATTGELRQALEVSQKLLLNLRGQCRELLKKNALLEASASQGRRKKLTGRSLALAAKESAVKAHGRKYSITHCLWIDVHIFPLLRRPTIDLSSKERWLSPLAIEDGVKVELFQFIPETDHGLMSHKDFGSPFSKGVNCVRSEMLSDVKSSAGIIFGMSSDIFLPGYDRRQEQKCRSLIVNPAGSYTKFAPVLFPRPENLEAPEFLKTATLIKVLRASIFGKASLSSTTIPAGKTKAKIWELRTTTAGMIAAAAVVAIFILSGDKDLVPVGAESKIPYRDYHNWYRQWLMSGDKWSKEVFAFFNNSLFSTSTSSLNSHTSVVDDNNGSNAWEEEFERAMEEGGNVPTFSASAPPVRLPAARPLDNTPPSQSLTASYLLDRAPDIAEVPRPPLESISLALQDMALDSSSHHQQAEEDIAEAQAMVAEKVKPRPRPVGRPKGKAAGKAPQGMPKTAAEGTSGENLVVPLASTRRRSGRNVK